MATKLDMHGRCRIVSFKGHALSMYNSFKDILKLIVRHEEVVVSH